MGLVWCVQLVDEDSGEVVEQEFSSQTVSEDLLTEGPSPQHDVYQDRVMAIPGQLAARIYWTLFRDVRYVKASQMMKKRPGEWAVLEQALVSMSESHPAPFEELARRINAGVRQWEDSGFRARLELEPDQERDGAWSRVHVSYRPVAE